MWGLILNGGGLAVIAVVLWLLWLEQDRMHEENQTKLDGVYDKLQETEHEIGNALQVQGLSAKRDVMEHKQDDERQFTQVGQKFDVAEKHDDALSVEVKAIRATLMGLIEKLDQTLGRRTQ